MKTLVINIALANATFDDASGGHEVARILREAGESIVRAWGDRRPGDGKGATVIGLRDGNGNLVGAATIGDIE
jgi:hypothetical protein